MTERFRTYLNREIGIAPLVSLRVLFGFIMAISVARFMINGWVHDLYIKPQFFFTYYGFEWVKPLGTFGMYAVFVIMFLTALGIMLGCWYRLSTILFFVLFTYVELIDKTNYLNHYYFVSLFSFLFVLVPAGNFFSIDSYRNPSTTLSKVPGWTIDIFKLQLAIVYIFAGVAKLNSEWLFDAMPLRIWLPANNHLPFVGTWLSETWVAYVFSWFGAVYDLFIVFFLLNSRTRSWAYGAVVIFHLTTWLLFPIGMFPFIMILSTVIFFSEGFHIKFIKLLQRSASVVSSANATSDFLQVFRPNRAVGYLLAAFFLLQIALPFRHTLYPGYVFWTEEGYRFSWRVMLMEKAGTVVFHVKDPESEREGDVMPSDYLTPVQEKMMATQPDMILQFAHFLDEKLKQDGINDPEIRAEAYVTLNGRGSRKFIDDTIDLTKEKDGFQHKDWILSFNP